MTEPASIRYNNPGAMRGGNAISRKWGEQSNVELNDGKGQDNHIAGFQTKVHGAAAQIDLWRSARYRNQPFDKAIAVWSGGNSVDQYVKFVVSKVPGMDADSPITDAFLSGPSGIAFLKAQAWHEAGKPYPMTDDEWRQAQKAVFDAVSLPEVIQPLDNVVPPWLVPAKELVGLKEIVGSKHEAKILEFFAEAGHPEIHDDETAWCAAFVGAMLRRGGYASSGALNARSYLTYGDALKVPRRGCIAVFSRGTSGWEGHVAFFLRDLGERIEVLGGNQGNAVSITTEPKTALLGYRWPSVTSMPVKPPAPVKPAAPVVTGAVVGAVVGAGTAASVGYDWASIGLTAFIIAGLFATAVILIRKLRT